MGKPGDAMKVYLIHHADALSAEQDPERHLGELDREPANRLGARLNVAGTCAPLTDALMTAGIHQ